MVELPLTECKRWGVTRERTISQECMSYRIRTTWEETSWRCWKRSLTSIISSLKLGSYQASTTTLRSRSTRTGSLIKHSSSNRKLIVKGEGFSFRNISKGTRTRSIMSLRGTSISLTSLMGWSSTSESMSCCVEWTPSESTSSKKDLPDSRQNHMRNQLLRIWRISSSTSPITVSTRITMLSSSMKMKVKMMLVISDHSRVYWSSWRKRGTILICWWTESVTLSTKLVSWPSPPLLTSIRHANLTIMRTKWSLKCLASTSCLITSVDHGCWRSTTHHLLPLTRLLIIRSRRIWFMTQWSCWTCRFRGRRFIRRHKRMIWSVESWRERITNCPMMKKKKLGGKLTRLEWSLKRRLLVIGLCWFIPMGRRIRTIRPSWIEQKTCGNNSQLGRSTKRRKKKTRRSRNRI